MHDAEDRLDVDVDRRVCHLERVGAEEALLVSSVRGVVHDQPHVVAAREERGCILSDALRVREVEHVRLHASSVRCAQPRGGGVERADVARDDQQVEAARRQALSPSRTQALAPAGYERRRSVVAEQSVAVRRWEEE